MYIRALAAALLGLINSLSAYANKLFIPMDTTQANHLKAYGVVYNIILGGTPAEWLLNYKGGSFAINYSYAAYAACTSNGITTAEMSDATYDDIVRRIKAKTNNGDVVTLARVPRIAVYTPSGKKPWDDAVTLVLTYAGIPFDKLYVDEVLAGELEKYDWLHLHHEDFTGQYGKFWAQFKDAAWYIREQRGAEQLAQRHGYTKVSQMQLAVVKKIRSFVASGGNLFAMCSATDTYDIALAADGTDICDSVFDGDGMNASIQDGLNFAHCFAFTGFTLSENRYEYEYSNIDNTILRQGASEADDYFKLSSFSARKEPVPTMLCQNHTQRIKGFIGQTTAYRREFLKPGVVVMGYRSDFGEARYIHGRHGAGSWTFYGGHDPEDYQHKVDDPVTDLANYPNSPGYRLILNNFLCMASGIKHDSGPAAINLESGPATVKITPGSTDNTLVITVAKGSMKVEQVVFVNTAGKEILSKRYNAASVTIDMATLPPGLYSIKVNGAPAGKVMKN